MFLCVYVYLYVIYMCMSACIYVCVCVCVTNSSRVSQMRNLGEKKVKLICKGNGKDLGGRELKQGRLWRVFTMASSGWTGWRNFKHGEGLQGIY